MIFEPGRVCTKTAGREAGKHCAVLEVASDNFVVVSGPEVRKRKCNVAHLNPLSDTIDISKDINQQLIEKYNIKLPEKRKKQKEEKKEKPKKEKHAEKGSKKSEK